ncbi:MAG TPA: hypothetical protein VIQ23_10095 [Hanamia sp.]
MLNTIPGGWNIDPPQASAGERPLQLNTITQMKSLLQNTQIKKLK